MNDKAFFPTRVWLVIGLVVLAGVGVYFYQQSNATKEEAGRALLYRIQKTYEDELKALPTAEQADRVSLDVDVKFSKTVSELNGLLSRKEGGSATSNTLFQAAVKLGTLYSDHENTEKALAAIKTATTFAKTPFQKGSAFYLLGSMQERLNQAKESIDSYQKCLDAGTQGLNGECLLGIVRNNLKLNDKEKAKLFAEKLSKDFPGTKAAEDAQALITQR